MNSTKQSKLQPKISKVSFVRQKIAITLCILALSLSPSTPSQAQWGSYFAGIGLGTGGIGWGSIIRGCFPDGQLALYSQWAKNIIYSKHYNSQGQ